MKLTALLLIALATALPAFGQPGPSLIATSSKSIPKPGETVTITITLAGQTSPNIAAFQLLEAVIPAGATAGTPVAGSALTAAGKMLNCTALPLVRCLAVGAGTSAASVIQNGQLMTFPLTAPNAPGQFTVSFPGCQAATPNGSASPLACAPTITLAVSDPRDVNNDGKIDATDVSIVSNLVLLKQFTAAGDVNADGVVDIRDVQVIAAAAQ